MKNFWQKLLTATALLALLTVSAAAQERLKMSTTTSTDNSGLLNYLHEHFTEQTGIEVAVIAVGTGKALKLGDNGDVDIAFVHAPEAELEYMEKGAFSVREPVMYNDFVVVGPESDPAGIAGTDSAAGAFTAISENAQTFVSRGDDSGTHKKEMQIWSEAGIEPEGSWYRAAGQGMGAVLKQADEMQGYALSDRGTQIAFAEKMSLVVLNEGDAILENPYHIMIVNPDKHAHARADLAREYVDFITSEQGQQLIGAYTMNDQQLFYPNAR